MYNKGDFQTRVNMGVKTDKTKELEEWAKDALYFYNEQVKNCPEDSAYSFYTQSNLYDSINSKLLIVGINPGEGCLYKDWQDKDIVNEDYLLKGNKCFHGKSNQEILYILNDQYDPNKKRKGWHLYHRMKTILSFANKESLMTDITQFSLINLILFATRHIDDLPRNINRENCTQLTLRLIDIIAPEVIVLLGSECKEQFEKATGQKFTTLVDGSIAHCIYNDKNFFSIKHTAYCYTFEELQIIGKIIGYSLDNRLVSKEIIQENFYNEISLYKKRKKDKSKRIISCVADNKSILALLSEFCSYDINLSLVETNSSWNRYRIPNTDCQLRIVAQKQKQYIAVHCNNPNELSKIQSKQLFHHFKAEGTLLKIDFNHLGKSTEDIINQGKEIIQDITNYFNNNYSV